MPDLAGWLLEQIDTDEQGRQSVHRALCGWLMTEWGDDACECRYPERVLAECAAKRRIVDLFPIKAPTWDEVGNFQGMSGRSCGEHRTVGPHRSWCYDCSEWCYPDIGCTRCGDALPHDALLLLAAVYADRLGYDPSWAPSGTIPT